MRMAKDDREPLTQEEAAEKGRLRDLIKKHSPQWEALHPHEGRLTQAKLGQIVGEMTRDEPVSQGMVWQYTSKTSATKLNAQFVQATAALLGFDVAEVSERFRPRVYVKDRSQPSPAGRAHGNCLRDKEGGPLPETDPDEEFETLMQIIDDDQAIEILRNILRSVSPKGALAAARLFLDRAEEGL